MKRRGKILVVLAALLAALVFASYYAVKNILPNDDGEFLFAGRTQDYSFLKYGNGFLTYDNELLSYYGKDAEQEWVIEANDSDSCICVTGDWILIASKDTDKLKLIKNGKVQASFESDKEIRNVYVNNSGYSAVLSSDSGYKGQCSIYNDEGERIARYSYGKKYIVNAYIADDNKSLIMSVIDEEENMFKGKLIFTDIKSGKDKAETETGSIAPFMQLAGNRVIVSDREGMKAYDKNGRLKWSFSYDGGSAEYIKCSDKYITAVIKASGTIGKTEVVTFNQSGREIGRYTSDSPIDAFDVSKGYSAIKVGNEIKLLNRHGKVTAFTECDANTYDIKLYKNENRVLTVSGTAQIKVFGR